MSVKRIGKVASEGSGVGPVSREEVLAVVAQVFDAALPRLSNRYLKNSEKVAWARVLVAAASAAAPLLRDEDLDELARRLDRLEGR